MEGNDDAHDHDDGQQQQQQQGFVSSARAAIDAEVKRRVRQELDGLARQRQEEKEQHQEELRRLQAQLKQARGAAPMSKDKKLQEKLDYASKVLEDLRLTNGALKTELEEAKELLFAPQGT